jgi:phage tail-like protein
MVPRLESPAPVVLALPALFQDSDFTARFTSAFDAGLAPVFATLDNLAAYLDPQTAPPDFLRMLSHWVAAAVDDRVSLDVQRQAVAGAVPAHRARGTASGVRQVVAHLTGGDVTTEESGAAAWSTTPRAALPGCADARLTVRVSGADPATVDESAIRAAVAGLLPPHVRFEIEVMS